MLLKERDRLYQIIKNKAILKGRFKLSSGGESEYYIDGRLITLDPEGAYLLAKIILGLLKGEKVDAIGGLTIGGDPIIASVVAISYIEGSPISGFIVRKEAKEYGTRKLIEGPSLKKGFRVVIVDDVVTTGNSIFQAIRAVEKEGCKVVRVIALVDRLEGAKERLRENGYPFTPIFTKEDFVFT